MGQSDIPLVGGSDDCFREGDGDSVSLSQGQSLSQALGIPHQSSSSGMLIFEKSVDLKSLVSYAFRFAS